jgi:phosphoserine phosphatase
MDLVIQSPALSSETVAAFKVAALAQRAERQVSSARLVNIQDDESTRKAATALGELFSCDVAFVPRRQSLADFRVLALDMDSTLINIETLDEVAALAGCGTAVAALTEAAMRGEISDYKESLRRRVALLTGVEAALLQRVADERMRANAGATELIAGCKAAGLTVLLATGGFTFFAERMQRQLGIDSVRANELVMAGGRLTGEVTGPDGGDLIDAQGKAQAVRDVCAALGCATERAIAIGDGANDLAMMKIAGMSVAYRAQPAVRVAATHAIDHSGLDAVLNWFA